LKYMESFDIFEIECSFASFICKHLSIISVFVKNYGKYIVFLKQYF